MSASVARPSTWRRTASAKSADNAKRGSKVAVAVVVTIGLGVSLTATAAFSDTVVTGCVQRGLSL